MIDTSLPSSDLYLALFGEQLKLEALASLSITESTQARDDYLANALAWLYEQLVDPASGEFYQKQGNQIQCHSVNNAIVACWAISAGRALYSGELSQYGLRMLAAAKTEFWNEDSNTFIDKKVYPIEESPLSLKKVELKNALSPEEYVLLEGYLGKTLSDEECLCTFKQPMTAAARFANMHIKQAQIVDHSLRAKLHEFSRQKLAKQKPSKKDIVNNQKNEVSRLEEVMIFSCLTQAAIWSQQEIELSQLVIIAEKIKQRVLDNHQDIPSLIYDLYALLEFGQLNSEIMSINSISNIVAEISWQDILCELSRIEFILLSRVLSACFILNTEPNTLKTVEQILPLSELENVAPYFYQATNKDKSRFIEKFRITEYLVPLTF